MSGPGGEEARAPDLVAAQRLLAEQAAELRENALFPEMNPGPVCRLDMEARVLRANRAATATFGTDLIGRCWKDVLPDLTPEAWDRITAGDRVWLETEADGTHFGFTMARAPESDQVFVYGADITALKDAERRLAEMARFPEMNPGPVLRLDREGVILLANRAARELFGGEALVGKRWTELCPGLESGFWERVLESDVPLDLEARLAGRHLLFTHTHDELGDQVFVYGADLTQLKTTERALRQAERMATLGTLAAGVAHELNNPAAAVQRAAAHLQVTFGQLQEAQLALGKLRLDDEVVELLGGLERTARERAKEPPEFDPLARSDREYDVELWLEDRGIEDAWEMAPHLVSIGYDPRGLDELADILPDERLGPVLRWIGRTYPVHAVLEEVRHGASRISEIVTALKAYSYVGQAPVQSVDVHEGLRHTLIILRSKLKRGVTVELELDPDLPRIQAYGGDLNQVWTNLIDNAADAMEGEGVLTLRTATEDESVRVEIEDDGPGIPEAIQGRIFDPFFTTKEPGRGTGLGLHTTYDIVVKKHGGSIELHSTPVGTRFVVHLPRFVDADGAEAAPPDGPDDSHTETGVPE